MLMVTPLDYYLHNSTFITLPEGRDKCVKQKEKASWMGGFQNGSVLDTVR